MSEKHKEVFFNELIPYVNVRENSEENEKLLNLIIDSIKTEYTIVIFSELNCLFKLLSKYDFETVYLCIKNNKNKELINEVLELAYNLNKKARVFAEYVEAKKYGFKTFNLSNELNKLIENGMTKDDLNSFINIPNTDFYKNKDFVIDYYNNHKVMVKIHKK